MTWIRVSFAYWTNVVRAAFDTKLLWICASVTRCFCLDESVETPASKGKEKGFSCLVIKVKKDIRHQREEHLDLKVQSPVLQPAIHLHYTSTFTTRSQNSKWSNSFFPFSGILHPQILLQLEPSNCLCKVPSDFSPLLLTWRQRLPNRPVPLMKRTRTSLSKSDELTVD